MFCGGTILALSASEDGVSGPLDNDAERRAQAKIDLNFLVKSLQEAGETWTTAHTSASVLEGSFASFSFNCGTIPDSCSGAPFPQL